ncbi:MAG: hypothetical protein U5R14_11680 [Gemmatimonadota bacterium]|nr:hypothetical protein [Gemmatimonadota bacterium]
MSDQQKSLAKRLVGITLGALVLAIGLWTVPGIAGASSNAANNKALSVSINVPLSEIKDGQFCQAYAVVSGGTGPYVFTWDGQFDNSDGQFGPLGEDQIVNGYIDGSGDHYLDLTVQDTINNRSGDDLVFLNIGDEFNDDCEA